MSRRGRGGGRRKKSDPFICPQCGTRVEEPTKTWTLVSPLPDKYGRITVTVMGSFECPNCGYKWRAVVKKLKVGGEEQPERARREKEEKRQGEIIEIDLDELDKEEL